MRLIPFLWVFLSRRALTLSLNTCFAPDGLRKQISPANIVEKNLLVYDLEHIYDLRRADFLRVQLIQSGTRSYKPSINGCIL